MGRQIVTEVQIPQLAEAVGARGYALVMADAMSGTRGKVAAVLRRWGSGICLPDGDVPQIVLASCAATIAAALDAGAADAVAFPIDADELAARVDARIRRHAPPPIVLGDLHIDRVHRQVTRAGRPVELRAREYALLLHLAERRGECVSRADLLAAIWRLSFDPGTNVVAVHMSKLRARLHRDGLTPLLHTVKGLGYRLETH